MAERYMSWSGLTRCANYGGSQGRTDDTTDDISRDAFAFPRRLVSQPAASVYVGSVRGAAGMYAQKMFSRGGRSETLCFEPLDDLVLEVTAGEDDVPVLDGVDLDLRGLGAVGLEESLFQVPGEMLWAGGPRRTCQ